MAKELTFDLFETAVEKADKPVLVDFWASWCGPCRALSPVVDQIGEEMADKIDVYKCNADEEGELLQRFGVMSIPTLMLFKNGEVAVTMVGNKPKAEIVATIEQNL